MACTGLKNLLAGLNKKRACCISQQARFCYGILLF